MSKVADSFKPPCLLGYYPCISNPSSKDCAIMDTCSKDLFFCKFANLALLMELIFRVSAIVLIIGIVRMAAVPVLGEEVLSVDVLEAATMIKAAIISITDRIRSDVLQEVQRVY